MGFGANGKLQEETTSVNRKETPMQITPASACVVVTVLLLIGLGQAPAQAMPISFSDGFEGATFDPFWTVTEQNGTVSLSSAQAQAGLQSAAFTTSSSSGQKELHLLHTFSSSLMGDASVYFFDPSPGQATFYSQMTLQNSLDPTRFLTIGIQDFDANCYVAFIATPGMNLGPNGDCGFGPRLEGTSVQRSAGWHQFEISVDSFGAAFHIDNTLVFSASGSFPFDTVNLFVSGPRSGAPSTFYYDTFNFVEVTQQTVPEPATLALFATGLLASCRRLRRRSA
jgi:hypothetical protein